MFYTSTVGRVKLSVFTIAGQRVATLIDDHLNPGRHVVNWNGHDGAGRRVAAGIYVYGLESPFGIQTRKFVLLVK